MHLLHIHSLSLSLSLSLPCFISHSLPLFLPIPLTVSYSPTVSSQIFLFLCYSLFSPLSSVKTLSFHVYHTHIKSPSIFFNDYLINTYNACICSLCVTLFVKILTQQGSKQFFIGVPGIKKKIKKSSLTKGKLLLLLLL